MKFSRPSKHKPSGLGDLVAIVAQPIARAIDRAAGTHLRECSACKQRQAALNRAIPFKSNLD